jgi:integrase
MVLHEKGGFFVETERSVIPRSGRPDLLRPIYDPTPVAGEGFLDPAQAELLLSSITERISKSEGTQMFNLYSYEFFTYVLLFTGCRLSEGLTLSPSSFKRSSGVYEVVIPTFKKRDKSKRPARHVPLYPILEKMEREYRLAFSLSPHSTRPYFHFRDRTYQIFLRQQGTLIGLPRIHPHALRHTFAIWHMVIGYQLDEIRDFFGHESVRTTEIYLRLGRGLKKLPEWSAHAERIREMYGLKS